MLAVGAERRRNTAALALVETLWLADDPARIVRPKTQGGGDDDRAIECHAQAYDAPGFPTLTLGDRAPLAKRGRPFGRSTD